LGFGGAQSRFLVFLFWEDSIHACRRRLSRGRGLWLVSSQSVRRSFNPFTAQEMEQEELSSIGRRTGTLLPILPIDATAFCSFACASSSDGWMGGWMHLLVADPRANHDQFCFFFIIITPPDKLKRRSTINLK
jgi:hypothetical protein